jgi:hypothetical protein
VRRKYKPKAYRDGGRVPVADVAIPADAAAEPEPSPPAAAPPEPEPNRLIEALAAQRRAEQLQQHHAAQPQPEHQQALQLPEEARAWLHKHPEFVQDPVLNERLGAVHHYLTKVDGIEPFSSAYFDAIDSKFGFKAAPAAAPAPAAQQRRSIPVSAPVARNIPTASGRREPDGWNKLTAEEVRIAHNSFTDPNVSNVEKERMYLANKRRYLSMKADGSYSSQGDGG